MVAAESRSKDLQEELTATYKEKSRLAEELVGASRQLQIVRDSSSDRVQGYLVHRNSVHSGYLCMLFW